MWNNRSSAPAQKNADKYLVHWINRDQRNAKTRPGQGIKKDRGRGAKRSGAEKQRREQKTVRKTKSDREEIDKRNRKRQK